MRLTTAATAPSPQAFVTSLLQQLQPHLATATAADLAGLLQSLGRLGYSPSPEWMGAVFEGAEEKLKGVGDQVGGLGGDCRVLLSQFLGESLCWGGLNCSPSA